MSAIKYPVNEIRLAPAPKFDHSRTFPTATEWVEVKKETERHGRDVQKTIELLQKAIDELQTKVAALQA